jgi:DNA modification methylase
MIGENMRTNNNEIQIQLEYNIEEMIEILNTRPWTAYPYNKENWGNRLHAIAPYMGRIKPAFAHWIIKTMTVPGDTILDPFCGIGTVPLEADLLGRKGIGIDLNDYAIAISKSKFDRRTLNDNINWLSKVNLKDQDVDISNISEYIKKFYHIKTLKEILKLRDKLIADRRNFLLGCLLGISHGHRPQYLSAWTGYIVPFNSVKTEAEYKEVIPRMVAKVKRTYKSDIPLKTNSLIMKQDARNINLSTSSVDVIVSSPPYFDTIDYVASNKLRLGVLGLNEEENYRLKEDLIQKENNYLEQMEIVGKNLKRVLKNKGLCIFVLGDLHKNTKIRNTAQEVAKVYENLGFRNLAIIEDEIPLARRTANKWKGGKELLKTRKKYDRILVMRLNK